VTQHRGYEITFFVVWFPGAWIVDPTYTIKHNGQVVYEGVTRGLFDSEADAEKAASADACRWIDQHGT